MAAFFPHLRIKSHHKTHNAGKTQVTPVGASVSAPLYLNGGIPQGTKWGSVLFAIMVNDLVQSWGAHIKLIFFSFSRPMATGTERFSNFVSVKY